MDARDPHRVALAADAIGVGRSSLAAPSASTSADSPVEVRTLGFMRSRPGSMSALVALTVLFSLELLRVFPSLVSLHLGTSLHARAEGALLLGPFVVVLVLLVGMGGRWPRALFVGASIVVVAARLGVQMVEGPVSVLAAGVGLAAALAVLGILAGLGLPLLGVGVLAGVGLDAAIHTGLASRHLVWVDSAWAVAVVVGLALWFACLVGERARRDLFVLGRRARSSVPLVVLGPVLVVEGFMLTNLGWLGQLTGLGWAGAAVLAGAGVAAGLCSAISTARSPGGWWPVGATSGCVALLALSFAGEAQGVGWAPAVLAAQVAVGAVLTAVSSRGVGTGGSRTTMAALGLGYLGSLAAIVMLDGRGLLGLPLRSGVVLGATAVLALIAVSLTRRELMPRSHRPGRAELSSVLGVFVIPAGLLLAGVPLLAQPGAPAAAGPELRVVTYNVGLAFDLDGRLNFDGVAATLDEMSPDVVSLQEVPRGLLPTGGGDLLGWLQHRLEMPYVAFQPSSSDALHGNAILSRFPLETVEHARFDRVGTALPRGALAVEVSAWEGAPVTVIATHLPPGGTLGIRANRVDTIVELWSGRPRTVVAGDLNTQPGSDIIDRFEQAGMVSGWDTEHGPGYTFPADAPRARIDWILTTDDLTTTHSVIGDSLASDHRPLLAVVRAH